MSAESPAQITNPTALRWLVRRLMASPGGLFSISKFATDLKSQGIPVGKETLLEYLDHLEDAYLVETVSIATDSIKRKQVNPRKVYPIDSGFIPLFDRSGKSNIGHALETAVYLHLRRSKADISYVKTKNGFEVDFLAHYIEGEEEEFDDNEVKLNTPTWGFFADITPEVPKYSKVNNIRLMGGIFTR